MFDKCHNVLPNSCCSFNNCFIFHPSCTSCISLRINLNYIILNKCPFELASYQKLSKLTLKFWINLDLKHLPQLLIYHKEYAGKSSQYSQILDTHFLLDFFWSTLSTAEFTLGPSMERWANLDISYCFRLSSYESHKFSTFGRFSNLE